MYVFKNTATKLIKKNRNLEFDQLIKKAKNNKLKIGTFFISDKDWQDTGEFNKLEKTLTSLQG